MSKLQKMPLEDNRSYQIYALIDPRDDIIRYVGLSIDAQIRYKDHLKCLGVSHKERRWISELKQIHLKPLLRILETIETDENAYTIACERELYWIRKMKDLGNPLLNHLGTTQPYVRVPPPRFPIPALKKYNYDKVSSSTGTAMSNEESLTIRDVVRELDVNEKTVRRWIHNGELHATRDIVGRYRISRTDLQDFVRRRMGRYDDNDGD